MSFLYTRNVLGVILSWEVIDVAPGVNPLWNDQCHIFGFPTAKCQKLSQILGCLVFLEMSPLWKRPIFPIKKLPSQLGFLVIGQREGKWTKHRKSLAPRCDRYDCTSTVKFGLRHPASNNWHLVVLWKYSADLYCHRHLHPASVPRHHSWILTEVQVGGSGLGREMCMCVCLSACVCVSSAVSLKVCDN